MAFRTGYSTTVNSSPTAALPAAYATALSRPPISSISPIFAASVPDQTRPCAISLTAESSILRESETLLRNWL